MKARTRGPLARFSCAAAKFMISAPDGTAGRWATAVIRAGSTLTPTASGAVAVPTAPPGGVAVKLLTPSTLAGVGAARMVASLVRRAVRLGVWLRAATGVERP